MFKQLLLALTVVLLLCPLALAQDSKKTLPDLPDKPAVWDVMDWIDKNGLAEARVGVRTNSKPARESDYEPRQDPYPALSVFYSEGFRLVKKDGCGVILKNDNTRLIDHSKLVQNPKPDQRYTAELYVPLSKLSIKKGKGPYRHTSNAEKAQLLGTWRTEFKSTYSMEDVVLTLFAPGEKEKLGIWQGETLTFTFDNKETSEKFNAAFREAIKICQPIKYVITNATSARR